MPVSALVVTEDSRLLEAAAPGLDSVAIGARAVHPDELTIEEDVPEAILLDTQDRADWEKALRELADPAGKAPAILVLLPEDADPPGEVPNPALMGFERAPFDWRWVSTRLRQLVEARRMHLEASGVFQDLADQTREVHNLRRIALYDDLTGLATRRHFLAGLRTAMTNTAGRDVALLYIDMDGFKRVNDTCGHWVGDQVLEHAAERMRVALRSSEVLSSSLADDERPILGRIGGDEFALALPGVDLPRAEKLAAELVQKFARPFEISGRSLRLGLSVGVTVAPQHSEEPEELLRCADVAMFDAKRHRGCHVVYSRELGNAAERNTRLDDGVREALQRNEFYVHYQPRVRVRNREVVGAEALVRWNNPALAEISPVEFIPVAERTGAIVEIGRWVFEQAVSTLTQVPLAKGPFRVSVNVSAQQFGEPGLARYVLWLLESCGVAPDKLEIEITESMALTELGCVVRELDMMHREGVQISLDDFGTGFSSLGVLLDLPIDCLKLDRSITRDIHLNSDAASVARAIIVMSHGLGLSVVAEGVEHEEQMQVLEDFACDEVQGFLFSPGVSSEKLLSMADGSRSR